MEEDKVEIRSSEVQEVLVQSPKWIIRWGITLFFAIVTLLMVGTWLFRYPQILNAPVTITTENPPATVMARTTGKISVLLIKDKEFVREDQYLAYIDNPTNFSNFLEASLILDTLQKFFTKYDTASFKTYSKKGYVLRDMPVGYSALIKQFKEYKAFLKLDFRKKKMKFLEEQNKKYKIYKAELNEQYEIIYNEHMLNQKQFKRDSLLFIQKLIPEFAFEKSQKDYLHSKANLKSAYNLITSTQITINDLDRNIFDLQTDFELQKNRYENELEFQFENMLSQLKQYEYAYVLKSPIDGKIAFTKFWNVNQYIAAGEQVFTVVPSDPKGLIGKMNLPIQGSGEVKIGMNVIIKLDNYPFKEYGALKGKVKSISLVPSNNTYITEISLENGLITNYGKKLDFSQEMSGTAEIIIKDMRLLEKLIQPIRYILKQNVY